MFYLLLPVFGDVISFPSSEQFSELSILGPNKMATDIPSNIIVGQNYSLYLGVGNHLDSSAYYICYIKLRNQTDPLPDSTTQSASPLVPLYEYRVFLQNGSNWTSPLTFSLPTLIISNNQSLLPEIVINNKPFSVDKLAQFDETNKGYYYQLFIELWAFNTSSQTLNYQDRYVYFWLNTTSIIDN